MSTRRYNADLIQWIKQTLFLQPAIEKWLDTNRLYQDFLASPEGWRCGAAQFRRTLRRMGFEVVGQTVNVAAGSHYLGAFPRGKYILTKGATNDISICQKPVQQAGGGTADGSGDAS